MSDGTVYEGDWIMGQKHGMGQLTMSDGSFYIGEFQRDLFNGKGQLKYGPNQSEFYNGNFKNGLKDGMGSYISADQSVQYVGEWQRNLKHGQGTLIIKLDDNRVKEVSGWWENDELNRDEVEVVVKEKNKEVDKFKGKVDGEFN